MQSYPPDFYERLGLKRYSSIEDVRASFRNLAKYHHPDKAGGDPGEDDYFKQLSEAYNTLGDEERKRQYDVYISGYYQWARKAASAKPEPVRKVRTREDLNRELEDDYKAFVRRMPLKWRYLLGTAVAISGMQILFRQLLYQRSSFMALWLLIGMFMVVLGWLYVINAFFKQVNISQIRSERNLRPERRTGFLFLGLILGSFALVYGGVEGNKIWQLSQYPGYSNAKIVILEGREGFPVPGLQYTDGQQWYYKAISSEEAVRLVDEPNIIIRFSTLNPQISRIER